MLPCSICVCFTIYKPLLLYIYIHIYIHIYSELYQKMKLTRNIQFILIHVQIHEHFFHLIRMVICNSLQLNSIPSNECKQLELNPNFNNYKERESRYNPTNSYSNPIHIIPSPVWRKYWKTQRNEKI